MPVDDADLVHARYGRDELKSRRLTLTGACRSAARNGLSLTPSNAFVDESNEIV